MTEDETGASFWLRGAAEIISGLGQEPDPDVDIQRIEEAFGITLARASEGADGSFRILLTADIEVRVAYSPPPIGLVYVGFTRGGNSVAPTTPLNSQRFSDLLVSRNFSTERWWGEHGRSMGLIFRRNALIVSVNTSRFPNGTELVRGVRAHWLARSTGTER